LEELVTSNSRECKKKTYQKPNLRVYGDIGTITRGVPSGKGQTDGTGKGSSMHKT